MTETYTIYDEQENLVVEFTARMRMLPSQMKLKAAMRAILVQWKHAGRITPEHARHLFDEYTS